MPDASQIDIITKIIITNKDFETGFSFWGFLPPPLPNNFLKKSWDWESRSSTFGSFDFLPFDYFLLPSSYDPQGLSLLNLEKFIKIMFIL